MNNWLGTMTSKTRKDLFEEQLRDLQKDITKLSQKLSSPAIAPNHDIDSAVRRELSGTWLWLQIGINQHLYSVLSDHHTHNVSFESINSRPSTAALNLTSSSLETVKKSNIDKLQEDLRIAHRERDDARYRLEQVRRLPTTVLLYFWQYLSGENRDWPAEEVCTRRKPS